MTFADFIRENYIILFAAIGLQIMLLISAHVNVKIKRYMLVSIFLIIITCFIQYIESSIREVTGSATARYILTTLKYILHPTIILTLVPIMSPFEFLKKLKWKLLIVSPLIVASIFYITSFSTHLICWFFVDDLGYSTYISGPLSQLPYFMFLAYYFFVVAQQLIYIRRASLTYKIILAYIFTGATLGLILFITVCEYDNYTGLLITSLLLEFLFFYINQASIDALTSLKNRQAFYQDTTRKLAIITGIISVDMNELKYLNDTYGHEKGDDALKTIGHILSKYSGPHSSAYRVGGDEFIILYSKCTEGELRKYINTMTTELKKTSYSCAFGYSLKTPNKNLQEALKEADESMYANKQAYKKELKENGIELHIRD